MVATITLKELFDINCAKKVLASGVLSQSEYHGLAEYMSISDDLGKVPVTYTVGDAGRFISQVKGHPGVPHYACGMSREIRAWLAHKLYHDIDIANSQLTIVLQTFQKQGLRSPLLEDLCINRKERLSQIIKECGVSHDIAKRLFISMCNHGYAQSWCKMFDVDSKTVPAWVIELQQEVHNNVRNVVRLYPYLQDLQENKKPGASNPTGKQIAYFYFHEERRCLEALFEAVKKSKQKVGSLIHDGLMVQRSIAGSCCTLDSKLLEKWEGAILEKTGYKVKLVEKPMGLNQAFVGEITGDNEETTEEEEIPLPIITRTDGVIQSFQSNCDIKNMLEQLVGFKNVKIVHTEESGFSFDADRSCGCPLCTKLDHGQSNWYILTICPQLFAVRSHALKCRQRIVGLETHREIQDILQTPDADDPYVSLFVKLYGNTVMWTGKRFMMFENHRWRTISAERVYNTMSFVSMAVLERLLEVLGRKRTELDMERVDQSNIDAIKAEKRDVDEHYNSTKKGIRYVKKHSNLSHFLDMAKCKLFREKVDDLFDVNPWLLGLENGVIDMSKGDWSFRKGKSEDYVSKSVGYSYSAELANKHRKDVEEMFKQIYPIDEEKEAVQRYFAYCLLGYHPQKKMLLLTDARGGYNGKSTVCKAIRAVLGSEYSVKPLSCFLYKSDRVGNIESHAAGTLSFRGIRLAVLEELDPKQQLDVQFLKDANGGRTSFRGRVIRSDEHIEFEWVTKQILAFNSDNMPRFDIGDQALLKRMMVVQHRARFCPTKEEYEREIRANVPYTHLANPDVDEKIYGEWRSALLEWCLGGLAEYKEKGFTTLPATCDQWVKKLADEQDLVGEFVKMNLEHTGSDSDVVSQADLYQEYKRNTLEERDKKTCMGKSKFFERLKDRLGKNCFKEQHGQERRRNVYLGWKFVEPLNKQM